MELFIHGIRFKPLNQTTNSTVQIGKPEDGNLVTAALIQNTGRNTVMRIAGPEANPYIELRPGDSPFAIRTEWNAVMRMTLTITYVVENQQQFTARDVQPALDLESTDPNDQAAVIYGGVLLENYVNPKEKCQI